MYCGDTSGTHLACLCLYCFLSRLWSASLKNNAIRGHAFIMFTQSVVAVRAAWVRYSGTLSDRICQCLPTLRLLERALLLFPITVVLLASLTFLFGGSVSVFHWWGAVAFILGGVALSRDVSVKSRCGAAVVFLLFLLFVWVGAQLFVTSVGIDSLAYHLPATRLLIEGWNPVYAPTPESLRETMQVEPWNMRLLHVLFMSKAVWIFNAVAYKFTGAEFNLFFPLFPFLFAVTCCQMWRCFRRISRVFFVPAVVLLLHYAPGVNCIVDSVVYFAGISLLMVMARALSGTKGGAAELLVFSLWMMISKQPGLLSCFVFWCCFSLCLLIKTRFRCFPRLAVYAGVLLVLFSIICASPYGTSWVHYGHPLYPAYSGDESQYPVYDITSDFREVNEDLRAMGHVGEFLNAYVSPWLVQHYYRWKLGKAAFEPNRRTWWQGQKEGIAASKPASAPLDAATRWCLLATLLGCLVLSRRGERFCYGAIAVGLFCFPTAYLGYLRYVPWCALAKIGAFMLVFGLIYRCRRRWEALLVAGGAFLWMALPIMRLVFCTAVSIDLYYETLVTLRDAPPKVIYGFLYSGDIAKNYAAGKHTVNPENLKTFGSPDACTINSMLLLKRHCPALSETEIHTLSAGEDEMYPFWGTGEFRLPKEEVVTKDRSYNATIQKLPNRRDRLMAYPKLVVRSYFVTLPKLLWLSVTNLFND